MLHHILNISYYPDDPTPILTVGFYHATWEFRVNLHLKVAECQGNLCLKQGRYLKVK